MKKNLSRLTAILLAGSAFAVGVHARAAAGSFQEDLLGQLADVEKKLVSLEEAMPDKKMTWRPDKGVRSVSEVYLHVAFGNYAFLKFLGAEPPADVGFAFDIDKWDKKTTDKAEIKKILEQSFA